MGIKKWFTVPEGEKITEKALRRVLISSICSILLCMTCLFSTTWAWFTVSIENTDNVIEIASEWTQPTEEPTEGPTTQPSEEASTDPGEEPTEETISPTTEAETKATEESNEEPTEEPTEESTTESETEQPETESQG